MLLTGAHSSRVRKSKPASLQRSSSSPFSANARRKPSSTKSKAKDADVAHEQTFDEPLDDTGVIASLATDLSDVVQLIKNARRRMFDELILDKPLGMNSTKISEVLNYRRSLPPIVTIAHIHALSTSITKTDREIAELVQRGIVRKVSIPNRTGNVGDGVVLTDEWKEVVLLHPTLTSEIKDKYNTLIQFHPAASTIPSKELTLAEVQLLSRNGFLTMPTNMMANTVDIYSRPGAVGSLASLSSVGSRGASGSFAAVGGPDAFTSSGANTGAALYGQRSESASARNFALPNTGSYLKLIVDARTHMVNLLIKSSKYKEAPMSFLRERWDGMNGVSPGRTTKYKRFYGLRFEFVVEECAGAGMIEIFETKSVGLGLRAL